MNPDQIKALRQQMDGLGQAMKTLPMTKDTLSAADDMFFAKAWLGKTLGELKVETPYKNEGKRENVEDIEPTADQTNIEMHKDWEDYTEIKKIDWIREQIGETVKRLDILLTEDQGTKAGVFVRWSYKFACESRFWLGFRLEAIRNAAQV